MRKSQLSHHSRQRVTANKSTKHVLLIEDILYDMFMSGADGEVPVNKLFFCIIIQALDDLTSSIGAVRNDAIDYFNGEMIHAKILGIRPETITNMINISGVNHFDCNDKPSQINQDINYD